MTHLTQEGREFIVPEKFRQHFGPEIFNIAQNNVLAS